MSEKDRFEKKKQLAQAQGVTRQKGVLMLADIVDFTPQTEQLGPDKTRKFEQAFESALKTMAPKYKGDYIKRIGDAVLLFFADETDALDFALRLRQASRQRELDCGDFACNLRIVAHFGKFDFQYLQGFLTDVTGADAIVVFRMEKRAKKHEILVTQFLLQLIDGDLKDKGIRVVKLRDEPLKGLQRQIAVYRLKIPEKETAVVSTNPLIEKMGELERETRQIPVFGKIYPAMSMQDNFVNLDIAAEEDTTAKKREENEREWKATLELREHKRFQQERLPLKVSELYEQYKRGIIFGLPGSGKTTILKYFAFRELQKNAMTPNSAKKRIVMFIQCRDIMSYVDWYRQHPGVGADQGPGIEYSIESILGYLVHSFLFTQQAPGPQAAVQAAELTAQRAYFQGRLTLLIDALDEAADREVKENIISILKELFFHSKEGKRYGNRFYLTARYPERERFPAKGTDLKPVFDVRSLDMEQLRQMAEYFYRDNPALYKEFDRVVWQEEIAAKVAGTPLTALLVIAYFQCFLKFDTRYHMYHVLLVFILIRAWKEIKEGIFEKDMETFFREARSLVILEEKPYITAGKIYDALTLLAYGYMKLKTTGEEFKNISKLSRPYFLEKYLTGEAYWQGDSEMMTLRKELLDRIIKQEPLDRWFSRHRVEKEPVLEVEASVLTLDSKAYHPEDKNFKYYQEYSGKEFFGFLGSPNLKHSGAVFCTAVSPDGRYMVSGSSDNTLKLWDQETGKEIRTFKGHSSSVWSVAFSPQGNVILSGSYDHTLKLWDLETGQCIKTIPLLWLPMEIKPAPHQPGLFATANANSTVTLFDFSEIIGKG